MLTQLLLDLIAAGLALGINSIPDLPPDVSAGIGEFSSAVAGLFGYLGNLGVLIPFDAVYFVVTLWLGAFTLWLALLVLAVVRGIVLVGAK